MKSLAINVEDNIEDVKWIVVQFNNDKGSDVNESVQSRKLIYKI